MEISQCCFFKDGQKRVDYVLVFDEENLSNVETYIHNLQGMGLEFEMAQGITVQKKFLLIHIPKEALEHFGKVFDVGIEEGKMNLEFSRRFVFQTFTTPLSHITREKGKFSSSERITIIHKLLESTKYGTEENEIGLSKLLRIGFISTAYPLHDGPLKLHSYSVENANDRQLLFHYWANSSVWYKEIPVDVIKTYFGCEVAFYFGWLEFFNIMLIPAAIFGVFVFLISVVSMLARESRRVSEMCSATNLYLCPSCKTGNLCLFAKTVSDYCYYAKWDFAFDNYSTLAFAIFMSFWATLFVNLWRRKSNILKLKWEVQFEGADVNPRLEYLDRVRTRKFNYITGKMEPYVPKYLTFARVALSTAVCIVMILMVIVAVFGVIVFKTILKSSFLAMDYFKYHSKIWSMCLGSILQVVFIKVFGMMYGKISIWLTDFENPRTQKEFDNSVLYKRYLLSFANNYAALFYIAFSKGRFIGMPHSGVPLPLLTKDSCQPTTCVFDLCTQLFFLIVFKRLAGNLITLFCPPIKRLFINMLKLKHDTLENMPVLPQYEEEYYLLPTNRYLLTSEFCQMVIEYGFITFFVAAFPLAPLCSLLNNVMEMRLDAYKLVARYRRPVPRMVNGIGAWDGVLLGLTYLSSATNAFVISFTSDFVAREVYKWRHDSNLEGFVNSTLSEFSVKDYDLYDNATTRLDVCYYRAMRHPPSSPRKYELTSDYWVDVTWRLIAVLIFEHIILVGNSVLSYAIPDVPQSVKDQLNIDRQLAKEAKVKLTKGLVSKGMVTRKRRRDQLAEIGPIGGYIF